jgi:hypothetical protein
MGKVAQLAARIAALGNRKALGLSMSLEALAALKREADMGLDEPENQFMGLPVTAVEAGAIEIIFEDGRERLE